MKKTRGINYVISFLFVLTAAPLLSANECNYGSVHAWFRTSDHDWENATAHPVLKRGRTFEIKIIVTVKTNLQVFYLKLHEFGTPVYDVISGPTLMEQLLEQWKPNLSEQQWTYQWKMRVRPDTSWVNGYGPLEVYVQFNKNDIDESLVNFDVITAFILDGSVEKCTNETENCSSQGKLPPKLSSLRIVGMIELLFLIAIFFKIQQKNRGFY